MNRKKIPPTLTKGAAKVPMVMQLEALECGAAALCMVMAYYQKWVPLEQVRADCGVSRDGSKASNIYKAAQAYGFEVKAFRSSPEIIRKDGTFPCIIHWGFNHFVVLDGFKGKYACINDPARGFVKVGEEEFDHQFTGVVLEMTPGADFAPSGKPKSTLAFALFSEIPFLYCLAFFLKKIQKKCKKVLDTPALLCGRLRRPIKKRYAA